MNIIKRFKDDNDGVAIIMATIITSVLLVFCLSLLMVSYTLYSSTNSQNTEFATKELTKSVAVQFENELINNNADNSIKKYLKQAIEAYLNNTNETGNWTPYHGNDGEDIDYRTFKLTDNDGRLGSYESEVSMYYESSGSGKNITLHVEISLKRGKTYYSIASEYTTSDLISWQRR